MIKERKIKLIKIFTKKDLKQLKNEIKKEAI
jgi:hypothetical protein